MRMKCSPNPGRYFDLDSARLHPAQNRFSRVVSRRIEANLGVGRTFVNDVDESLEQGEVRRRRSHSRADHDRIELFLEERGSRSLLSRLPEVDQAHGHVEAQLLEVLLLCFQRERELLASQAREKRVVDHIGVQTHRHHVLLRHRRQHAG